MTAEHHGSRRNLLLTGEQNPPQVQLTPQGEDVEQPLCRSPKQRAETAAGARAPQRGDRGTVWGNAP